MIVFGEDVFGLCRCTFESSPDINVVDFVSASPSSSGSMSVEGRAEGTRG